MPDLRSRRRLKTMLAGKPVRLSPAGDLEQGIWHEGFVKVRLGHSDRGTVIIPDMIFAKSGPWRFFQPSFFGPCIIGFNVEPGRHIAEFSADVGRPRSTMPTRLIVRIHSDAHVMAYPDGAQLYACQIKGPKHLAPCSSGRCKRMANGDFAVQLFHHTNKDAYFSIRASQEFWASSWNLQGTRRLKNVAYVYLTSLAKIEHPEDLNRIAMASDGILKFQTTSNRPIEEILEIQVYRESTTGRTNSLEVAVPTRLLAPPHLYYHPFVSSEPAYYEIVGPEIFRVGLLPGAKLPIQRGLAAPDEKTLKSFEYIVMGDTGNVTGLGSPYDEEDTVQVMHHEKLEQGIDMFDFWLKNANSNQMTRAFPERRDLDPE